MQFRRVRLRSIGPSGQKLWPNQIFGWFPHCYNVKLQMGGPETFMGLQIWNLAWSLVLPNTHAEHWGWNEKEVFWNSLLFNLEHFLQIWCRYTYWQNVLSKPLSNQSLMTRPDPKNPEDEFEIEIEKTELRHFLSERGRFKTEWRLNQILMREQSYFVATEVIFCCHSNHILMPPTFTASGIYFYCICRWKVW